MIIDRSNEFSDAQALAAVAARTVSTNVIDLQTAGDALGFEGLLRIRSKSAASGTATSVAITLETHTSTDFTAARTVLATINTTVGGMTLNKILASLRLPRGVLRYLAVVITPAGGNLTASIDAFIANDEQRNDFRTSPSGQPA